MTPFGFKVPRSVLLEALTRAVLAVKKSTLPVLECVLVEVKPAGRRTLAHITATDLDQQVETRFQVDTDTPAGAIALPAKRLVDVVKALRPDAIVEITVDGKTAKVVAGRSRFELPALAAEEFPAFEKPKKGANVVVPTKNLLGGLSRVAPMASREQSRPTLNGVLLNFDNAKRPVAVATDGYRVAQVSLGEIDGIERMPGQFIIPSYAVGPIGRLFSDEEEVELEADAGKLSVRGKTTQFTTRLVEGPYPPYESVFRGKSVGFGVTSRADLTETTKRVGLVNGMEKVALLLSDKEITLKARTPDQGTSEDAVSCEFGAVDGETPPEAVGLSARFLVEMLDAIGGEDIRFETAGALRQFYIRPASDPSGSTVGLISPMRLVDGDV